MNSRGYSLLEVLMAITVMMIVSGEAGWTYQGDGWQMRPFVEAQIGPEDLVRTGVDLTFGTMGRV